MPPIIANAAEFWDQVQWPYIALAGVFLAAALAVWIVRLRNRPLGVNTSDDTLTIFISHGGLQDLLHMACTSYPGVQCTKTKVRIDQDNRICPHIHFSLGGATNLKEVQRGLKERIQETLEAHLGVEQIGNIEFTVSGFRPDTLALPGSQILDSDSPLPLQGSPPPGKS